MRIPVLLLALYLAVPAPAATLPLSVTFKGEARFNRLVAQAQTENWRALPIGDRTARVGLALLGTPYENYTLEIHDSIEAPSVNLNGLDCWTFYEIALAFARMIKAKPVDATPADLLRYVELERYRNGRCTGSYLSRMHHLEEVFADNTRRGLSVNPTRDLGGVRIQRNVREMTVAWRSYRYLRHNPSLRPGMAEVERRVSQLPVYYLPKARVAAVEKRLRTGDVVAIVSNWPGGYTSHVGLVVKRPDGMHFLHASAQRSRGRKVILDGRISQYLSRSASRIGIIVYRPLDV